MERGSTPGFLFLQGVSEETKDELLNVDKPAALEESISYATLLNNHMTEMCRERAGCHKGPFTSFHKVKTPVEPVHSSISSSSHLQDQMSPCNSKDSTGSTRSCVSPKTAPLKPKELAYQ